MSNEIDCRIAYLFTATYGGFAISAEVRHISLAPIEEYLLHIGRLLSETAFLQTPKSVSTGNSACGWQVGLIKCDPTCALSFTWRVEAKPIHFLTSSYKAHRMHCSVFIMVGRKVHKTCRIGNYLFI